MSEILSQVFQVGFFAAMVRIAMEMLQQGMIDEKTALLRLAGRHGVGEEQPPPGLLPGVLQDHAQPPGQPVEIVAIVVLPEVFGLPDRAGQEPAAERAVRDDPDAELAGYVRSSVTSVRSPPWSLIGTVGSSKWCVIPPEGTCTPPARSTSFSSRTSPSRHRGPT